MYGLSLSLIWTMDGRRRMDTIQITSECFGQRRQARSALSVVVPENEKLFDLVETGPGVEFPFDTITSLVLDEENNLANGLDVDLTLLLALKDAKGAIEKNAHDNGTPPTIFLELQLY